MIFTRLTDTCGGVNGMEIVTMHLIQVVTLSSL